MLINTARAEVLDYAALAEAVSEKGLRVGLDVFAERARGREGAFDDPILSLPGVIGTHHIGASTDQAQEAIAAETVRIVTHVRRDRPRAERRQSREADAGDAHARRAPS